MTGESIPFPHIPNERVSGGPLVVSLGDDGNNDNNNEGDDNGNFHIFSIGIFVFSFVIVLIFIIRKLIKDSKQAQEEQEQERQRQQEAVTRRANSRQNNENNEILMKLSTKEKVNLIVHHFEQNKTSVVRFFFVSFYVLFCLCVIFVSIKAFSFFFCFRFLT